jgi:hypothetical protein
MDSKHAEWEVRWLYFALRDSIAHRRLPTLSNKDRDCRILK